VSGVTTTYLNLYGLPKIPLDRSLDALRSAATRAWAGGERAARAGAGVLSSYWLSAEEGTEGRRQNGRDLRVLDLVVVEGIAIASLFAFALAAPLAPQHTGLLFFCFAAILAAGLTLGIRILMRLAGEEEAVPTVALAARAAGRGRRIVKARLRWLRRILGRVAASAPVVRFG